MVGIGDVVWGHDSYGNLQHGEVKDIRKSHLVNGKEMSYVILKEGYALRSDYVFLSEEECVKDYQRRFEETVQGYCQDIKSVSDLVCFMYSHCVSCAEEYTDWEAREATYRKAKELLGIDLREVC